MYNFYQKLFSYSCKNKEVSSVNKKDDFLSYLLSPVKLIKVVHSMPIGKNIPVFTDSKFQ